MDAHSDRTGADDEVNRKEFLQVALQCTMGAVFGPEIDRLAGILPPSPESSRRRLGTADAHAIETMAAQFRATVYDGGGDLMHSAILVYLQTIEACDDSIVTEEVRARINLAAAELAWIAGWSCWDSGAETRAQRLWAVALQRAQQAETHPRSTDLTIGVLLDAGYLDLAASQRTSEPSEARRRRATSALRLVELGANVAAVATNGPAPASDSALVDLDANRAWALAALGDTTRTHDALARSAERFAHVNRDDVPPWSRHVTTAEIDSHRAHALALLARSEPAASAAAVEALQAVVTNPDLTYRRTRAFHRPDLAAGLLRIGEDDAGIQAATTALAETAELPSRHAASRLAVIAETADARGARSPEVSYLAAQVRDVLAHH